MRKIRGVLRCTEEQRLPGSVLVGYEDPSALLKRLFDDKNIQYGKLQDEPFATTAVTTKFLEVDGKTSALITINSQSLYWPVGIGGIPNATYRAAVLIV